MKSAGALAVLAVIAVCCLAVVCAAFFGAAAVVAIPAQGIGTPSGSPTPAPIPISRPVSESDFATLETLLQTEIPENDPAELAVRLGGVPGPIPETVPPPAVPPAVGDVRSFWASDTDSNENFLITATLHYITPHTYFWVENGVSFNPEDLQLLAENFENHTYPLIREFFGSEWSPGIDNDTHIYILYASGLGTGIAGYFSSADEVHPSVHEYSNAHEMFFLNADTTGLDETFTYGVLAHEFQHMVHWNVDRNEETWVNEGFAEIAALLAGYYDGGFDRAYTRDPDIPLTAWPNSGKRTPHYGGAFLFLSYFIERFGEDGGRQLAAHRENGFAAIDAVLSSFEQVDPLRGTVPTAVDLFQDFAAAIFLHDPTVDDGRFAFSQYSYAPSTGATETLSRCPTGPQTRDVNQFGIDYIRITCSGTHTLVFEGSTIVPVLPAGPFSGDHAFWSNRGDEADMTLTRMFDFRDHTGELSLEFQTWYDLEADYDYLYLLASLDGETWQILTTPRGTDADPSGNSFGWAYNGSSGGWVLEQVDISAFAGEQVWLRFEYVTDAAVNGEGMLLDDIAVPQAGYFTDFEADDGGWKALGFVRLQNSLPQTYRLSLITRGSSGAQVTYLSLPADNRLEIPIEIGNGAEEVILVVSGTTQFTRQLSNYSVEIRP